MFKKLFQKMFLNWIFQSVFKMCILHVVIDMAQGQFLDRRRDKSLCEKLSTPDKEYLMDQESKRCYPVGSQGPCGELMTFYLNPIRKFSKKYGFCDCDQGSMDSQRPCKDNPIRKRIYIHKDRRCYSVFSQGPCKRGEWLVLNESDDHGVCVPNRCLQYGLSRETDDQFWFYDTRRKQCYKSFSQGYCPQGMQLELVHHSQYPQCRSASCSGSLAYGIRSVLVSCQAGNRFSFLTQSCRGLYTTKFFGIG